MKNSKTSAVKKDIASTYNAYKEFEGKQYAGMTIGRRHKWYYDKGEWHDHKITPDLWEIEYSVTKRRAGHAPEGSGVPVGTEYHWYVMAHQLVKKLDANSYSTVMTGLKYKLAHKRADKDKWNISVPAQRKHLIKVLKGLIAHLEEDKTAIDVPKEENKKQVAAKRSKRQPKKASAKVEELEEA